MNASYVYRQARSFIKPCYGRVRSKRCVRKSFNSTFLTTEYADVEPISSEDMSLSGLMWIAIQDKKQVKSLYRLMWQKIQNRTSSRITERFSHVGSFDVPRAKYSNSLN